MNIQAIRNTGLGILLIALTACASSSILVGTAREPVEPELVKIYLEPPAGYETVALLEASDLGANGFSAQSRMNKVINRLKAEAADLGANGILLQGIDTQITGTVNSGFVNAIASGSSAYATGMGYSAAQTSKVGRAIAIYVPQGSPSGIPVQQTGTIDPPTASAPTTAPASNSTIPPATQSNWQKWGEKRD
ncbi:hypothetical protein [Stenotrophomonas humi]